MNNAYIVDAFTSPNHLGNPAAVYLLETAQSESWMQAVAAEFNLSETAFLVRQTNDLWGLRWFTPTCEVNLCGHATLASVHVLANDLGITLEKFRFATKSGELQAFKIGDQLQLNFPVIPTAPTHTHQELIALFDTAQAIYTANEDILIELGSAQAVLSYELDISELSKIPCRGIIITAQGSNCDFVSRFFAPRFGINEDPVTGSAHCALADFWAKKLGKTQLTAQQLSKRGGYLEIELIDDRVILRGTATTRLRGEFIG